MDSRRSDSRHRLRNSESTPALLRRNSSRGSFRGPDCVRLRSLYGWPNATEPSASTMPVNGHYASNWSTCAESNAFFNKHSNEIRRRKPFTVNLRNFR